VAELKGRMTRREFLAWWEFYDAHPFDDEARFHRPAALMASASLGYRFGDGKVSDNLRWLAPEPKQTHPRFNQASLNSLAARGFKPPR
jgi:hypothetical protein